MKKLIVSLFLTFTLLIISNNESIAACPSGWSSTTVTMTIGNCDYYIEVCYKCEVTNPGKVKVHRFWLVDSTCNNTLSITQITSQMYNEISTGAFIYANLCPDALYPTPPCEFGTKQFEVMYHYCWQQWYRYNGVSNVREYWPCDDNACCVELIEYCSDNGTIITTSKTPQDPPQSPPCELYYYEITWPTVLGTKSDCYVLPNVPCGIE